MVFYDSGPAANAGVAGAASNADTTSQNGSVTNASATQGIAGIGTQSSGMISNPVPNRAAVDPTVVITPPVLTVEIPGAGTIVVNRYNGGVGKKGSTATLDFDFNHNGEKNTYGVLQTVTVDTFSKNKAPYADPINGPKYYDDGIASVPRPDIKNPVYDLKTERMIPGLDMLPSRADGILRFHDTPQNPVSITPLYGSLSFQTVIVMRGGDTPVATITWGYTNQASGYVLQPLVITPATKIP